MLTVRAGPLFATGSAELDGAAVAVLRQVLDEATPPTAKVHIDGHTGSDGDTAYNQVLSERRAAAVAHWLAANGASPTSLTTRGWGETRHAVAETDEAAKAKNRRVVITVTQPKGEQR